MKIFTALAYIVIPFLLYTQNIDIVFPPQNYITDNDSITFQWNNHTDSVMVDIATDSSFNNIVFTSTQSTPIVFTSTQNNRFYWRAKPKNQANWTNNGNFLFFELNSIPSLNFHLDPAVNIQTNTNQQINQWKDKIGNIEFNQNNTALQPLQQINQLNYKNIVRFGNSLKYLATNTAYNIPDSFTIILAQQNTHQTNANYLISNTYSVGFWMGHAYQNKDIGGWDGVDDGYWKPNNFSYDWRIISFKNSSAFINSNIVNPLTTYGDGELESFNFAILGARAGDPNAYYDGYLGDVLIFNEQLDDSTRILVEDYLKWKYTPIPNLGNDTTACASEITLKVPFDNGYSEIIWSNGETNVDSIIATTSGTYWVSIKSFGLHLTDTIQIHLTPKPQLNLNQDTLICANENLFLTYESQGAYEYTWNTGNAADTLHNPIAGSYYIVQNDTANNCIIASDPIAIQIDSFALQSTLGADRSFCLGSNLYIETSSQNNEPYHYQWSTGDTIDHITLNTVADTAIYIEVSDVHQCVFKDTIQANVQNLASPTVDFIADTVCFGNASSLSSISTSGGSDNIVQYQWTFPNNTIISGSSTASYTHPTAITFPVNLYVATDSNCENSITKNVYLHKLPLVSFAEQVICANDSVAFTANVFAFSPDTIQNYSWYINNNLESNTANPYLFFDQEGLSEIKLIVNTHFGCSNTSMDSIAIFPELKANFSTTQNCLGDSVIFTDASNSLSVVNWNWKTNGVAFSTQPTAKKVFNTLGAQNVSLEIINAIGCRSSISKNIMISPQPIANFGFDKACAEDSSLFYDNSILSFDTLQSSTWQIDTSIYANDSIKHYFSNNNDVLVKYHITTKNACTDDTLRIVNVHEKPITNFSFNPKYGEAPLEVQFENETENTTQFQWNFGTGNDFSTEENPTFTYGENGIYNISLLATNALNCSDKKTREIHIAPSFLDIDLSNLKLNIEEERGTLKVKPQLLIKNIGTRTIENADLLVSLNQNAPYAKLWQGDLMAGSAVNYIFDDYIVAPSLATNQYICVEATNVNDNTETLLNNNKVCALLNGLVQISTPYPNPANDYIYIDIITESAENIAISVFNAVGKKVQNVEALALKKGYNQIEIETKKLQADKYFIVLKYLEQNYRKTFWVK